MNTWIQALVTLFSAWALGAWQIEKTRDQEREFYILKEKKTLVREWQEDLREIDELLGVDFNQALQALASFIDKNLSRDPMIFNEDDKKFIPALEIGKKISHILRVMACNGSTISSGQAKKTASQAKISQKGQTEIIMSFYDLMNTTYLLDSYIQDRLSNEKNLWEKYRKTVEK